jgi:acetyltransferase-like isoleucine patch superfamily enzyme
MTRGLLSIPETLRGALIAGLPVEAWLLRTCAEAGLDAEVVAPTAAVGAGPVVVVDARFVALSAGSLWRVARAAEADGAALVSSSGSIAAAGFATDPGITVEQALARPPAHPLALEGDEAVPATDAWGLAVADRTVRQRLIAVHVRNGVRFVDPWRVVVEPGVRLAPGAMIWPDVVLRGSTDVDGTAEVQSGCWLVDTRVGARAVVKPHSVCEGAVIGPDCAVGPMAHLRPGAVLVADVKVGNFVEIKATTLRKGAKASHLSYLGDAEVGEDANVGAGTITCNYDGFGKHRTSIGARAFIGSNTALVAPVRVGDGAIVGAGSVITRDVDADALAVERSEQRVFPGKAVEIAERNRARAAQRKKP